MKPLTVGLAAAIALSTWSATALAGPGVYVCAPFSFVRVTPDAPGEEVIVEAPFVGVRVAPDGPGDEVIVDAPFVHIRIPRDRAEYFGPSPESPSADEVEELPPPGSDELPPADPQPASRPFTLREFARAFDPAPGDYGVTFVHPRTGELVDVYFSLPHDDLEEVNVDRDRIEFDYDDHEVELRFLRDGRVRVEYDD